MNCRAAARAEQPDITLPHCTGTRTDRFAKYCPDFGPIRLIVVKLETLPRK